MIGRTANDVWGVGSGRDVSPLIDHWDGRHWKALDTHPPSTVTNALVSISLARTGDIIAFGSDYPYRLGGGKGSAGQSNNYIWIDCMQGE